MINEKSLNNLVKQKSKWINLPAKPRRFPEKFLPKLEEIALAWDKGEEIIIGKSKAKEIDFEVILDYVKISSLENLLVLEKQLPELIQRKKEESNDRTIEEAIVFLSNLCDGAAAEDGQGFNKGDSYYGKWLADRIKKGLKLTPRQAKRGLKTLQKYKNTQLGHLNLPSWEAVSHQYKTEITPVPEATLNKIRVYPTEIAIYFPYDRDLVEFVKQISRNREYNSKDRSWRFPLGEAKKLKTALEDRDFWIDPQLEGIILDLEREESEKLEQQANKEEEFLKDTSKLIEAAELEQKLPCGWNLFKHQKEGAAWLLSKRSGGSLKGGILADHMGLGKTIAALVAAKAVQKTKNSSVFVICPASLKANWLREAEKVGVAIEVYSWAKMPQPLESKQYLVIADEAHYAQNIKSARTKRLLELANNDNCDSIWLLSGTPIKNGRPVNLFPLLKAIEHPLSKEKKDYEKRYCAAAYKSVGSQQFWDNTGAAHLDELAEKTNDCILRRTKKDCLDLPEKQRIMVDCELEKNDLLNYQSEISGEVAEYRRRVKAGEVCEEAQALVTLGILRRIGSAYKVDAALEKIEELLEQDRQVVVFTEFLESAEMLYKQLKKVTSVELLTGATKNDDRQGIVDRFQSGETKVFVGTIKAGGVGLTLTSASDVILVDRPWTPGDAEQAEDRCHRIGQSTSVSAFWLQLGEIDETIDQLLQKKQERIDLVLQGKRKTLRGIGSPKQLAKELLRSM